MASRRAVTTWNDFAIVAGLCAEESTIVESTIRG